jgi:hypothetical protein
MMRYQDIVTTEPREEMPSYFVTHQFDGVLTIPSKSPALEAPGTHADERF